MGPIIPSLTTSHKTLLQQLVSKLKKRGREDILVICGGVIPAPDYYYLLKNGENSFGITDAQIS